MRAKPSLFWAMKFVMGCNKKEQVQTNPGISTGQRAAREALAAGICYATHIPANWAATYNSMQVPA